MEPPEDSVWSEEEIVASVTVSPDKSDDLYGRGGPYRTNAMPEGCTLADECRANVKRCQKKIVEFLIEAVKKFAKARSSIGLKELAVKQGRVVCFKGSWFDIWDGEGNFSASIMGVSLINNIFENDTVSHPGADRQILEEVAARLVKEGFRCEGLDNRGFYVRW